MNDVKYFRRLEVRLSSGEDQYYSPYVPYVHYDNQSTTKYESGFLVDTIASRSMISIVSCALPVILCRQTNLFHDEIDGTTCPRRYQSMTYSELLIFPPPRDNIGSQHVEVKEDTKLGYYGAHKGRILSYSETYQLLVANGIDPNQITRVHFAAFQAMTPTAQQIFIHRHLASLATCRNSELTGSKPVT